MQASPASQLAALVAGVGAAIWLAAIALLHLIKPELKPSTRLISEYATQPKGWIMQAAFYCLALACLALACLALACLAFACLALALAIWPYISHLGPALLALVALGSAACGLFVTDPVFIGKGGSSASASCTCCSPA